MCQELRALRQSIAAFAAGFDATALSPGDAAATAKLAAQIEASAASVKAIAAARAAEGKGWQQAGYRSASEQLADLAGMSPTAARRALDTGRRLAEQPEVASAALAGELSMEQAAAVSEGVAADPNRAHDLLEKAKNSSMPELNHEVAKVKAVHTDPEERRQEIQRERGIRRHTDLDGAFQAHLYGHPEHGVLLWRMIDPVRRRLNQMRRQAGLPIETFDQLDYDAVVELSNILTGGEGELCLRDLWDLGLLPQLDATALAGRTPPPTEPDPPAAPNVRSKKLAGSPIRIMVRVDLPTLLRGFPLAGEMCEIPGYGPVPVSVVRELLATQNPVLIGILTNGEQLLGVYRHSRRPNAHQRSALDFLHPTCAVAGCSASNGLQYDHRIDWAKTKITEYERLDRLCVHHHRLKTTKHWALVEGHGERAFVPPDDPRHPTRPRPPNERIRA